MQALRHAGAVIVGKTATTELGMSHPGPTRHPFDLRRTPDDMGGSTSRILRTTDNPIMNTACSQPHQDERATAIARWIADAVSPIMV